MSAEQFNYNEMDSDEKPGLALSLITQQKTTE